MKSQRSSLRGGGACKSSDIQPQLEIPTNEEGNSQPQLKKQITIRISNVENQESNFMIDLQNSIQVLKEKASSLLTSQVELKQALQLIFLNEHILQQMITDEKKVSKMVDLINSNIHELLVSTLKLIKQDTLIICQYLNVLSLFLRISFTFQLLNGDRVLDENIIKEWQSDLDLIEQEIKIEKITGCYKNQIDYELFVIGSVLQILQTNSQEGTSILKDLFSGIIEAVSNFPIVSINDTIKDALGKAFIYLVQQKIKQNTLDNYRIIYTIESYKWKFYNQTIQQILNGQLTFDDAINQVIILFQQLNVQNSWQTLYCWIRMIEFLITNQGRIIISAQEEYQAELIDKTIIVQDQSNAYLKTDKAILLIKENQQLIKTNFKGFDNFPIFYQGLIAGESILPQLDLYKINTILNKLDKVETNPIRLFMKQMYSDFKIEFNRIKQLDLNTRFIKFQNQCFIKMDLNSLTLEQINKFYEPKLPQLDNIIEIMQIQQYFFYHSFIFYSQNVDQKKENKFLEQFKAQQTDVISKMKEITNNLKELMTLRLRISQLLKYTEYNLKYNRNFSGMTFIKTQIIEFEYILKDIRLDQIAQLAEQHYISLKQLKKEMNYLQYEELLNLIKIESIMIPVEEWLKQKQILINHLILLQNNVNAQPEEQQLIYDLVLSEDIFYNLQSFCKILYVYKDFNNQKNKILTDQQFKKNQQNITNTRQPKVVDADQVILFYIKMKQDIHNKKNQQDCLEIHNLYDQYYKQTRFVKDSQLDDAKQILQDFIENQEIINQSIFKQDVEQLIDLIINRLKVSKKVSRMKKIGLTAKKGQIFEQFMEKTKENEKQILEMNEQRQVSKKQELRQFYILNNFNKVIKSDNQEQSAKPTHLIIKSANKQLPINQIQEDQSNQQEIMLEPLNEAAINIQNFELLESSIENPRNFDYLSQSVLVNSDGRDKLQLLCLQVYQEVMKEIQKHDSELDLSFLQKAQKIYNQLFNEDWRIRQCILRTLLIINEYCWNEDNQSQVDYQILKFKVFETDKRVNQLLTDKQYQDSLTEMYTTTWISQSEKIQDQIKQEIQSLNQLQSQIQNSTDIKQRQQLLSDYHTKQLKIQDQLKNVEDMGVIMGIQIIFLQDLKLDLIRLETKLDQIRDNLNNIQIDIQYLRGKNIYQMLEIRQNKILYQKQQLDDKNIYIPLFVKEFNYNNNNENDKTQLYTEQIVSSGEINEFIWGTNEIKNCMLIHGLAGCGKSTSARKIEEFLWQFNQTQKQLSSSIIPIIPIVISLPSLQDPAHLAFEQTLKSDSYNFDDKQILELKSEIDNEKIRLLIILDSYDEIKPQFQINLIQSNKFHKWGCDKDQDSYPKIIITSRTEVLEQDKKCKQFVSDEKKVKFYKEIRLINFDDTQIKNYIQEFCKLQAKQILLEQFKEFLKQNQQQQEMHNIFSRLWDSTQFQFDKASLYLIDEDQANKIIQIFKREKMELTLEKQQNLVTQLVEVWSPIQYLKYIDALNLQFILVTAFMMEIVIQVLPQMITEQNNIHNIGQKFKIKYKEFTKATDQEIEQIWDQLLSSQNFINRVNISLQQEELEHLIESSFQQKPQQSQITIISQAILSQNLTKYDFYQKFYEIYIKKQLSKLINENFNNNEETCYNEILKFATDLAIVLSNKNLTIISYIPQGYMYKRQQMWQDYFFDDTVDEKLGQLKKMYRKCIPIKQKFNSYQFNHKSLQEFLVARDLYHLLQEIIQNLNQNSQPDSNFYLDLLKNHNINQALWNTDFMKGTVEFIQLKIQSDQQLILKLQLVLQLSQGLPTAYQNLAFIQSKL